MPLIQTATEFNQLISIHWLKTFNPGMKLDWNEFQFKFGLMTAANCELSNPQIKTFKIKSLNFRRQRMKTRLNEKWSLVWMELKAFEWPANAELTTNELEWTKLQLTAQLIQLQFVFIPAN